MQRVQSLIAKSKKIVKRLALHCHHPPATTAPALYITARTDHVRVAAFIHFTVVQRTLLYTAAALEEALKNIPTAKVASYVAIWVFGNIAVFAIMSACHRRGISRAGRSGVRLQRRLIRYH
jgi:hypothetical protein